MLWALGKLIPKFIILDGMSLCVHQSMKYVVCAKSVMYNYMTTNQKLRKNDILSVKSNVHLSILYVDPETTVSVGINLIQLWCT